MLSSKLALPATTLAAFGGDELAARVFHEKYALRDSAHQVVEHTPDEMWRRVATEIASVEESEKNRVMWTSAFHWLLSDFRFLPGGRILHGAGNPAKVTLLNCYAVAIRDDSLEGIYDAAYRAARTYSRGGGVGIDITPLRPKSAPVHNAARTSTGAVSFMDLFSQTTGLIGQFGRRGAMMITIADHHPDVLDFVKAKRNTEKVRYANLSVRISDAFMRAVERDEPWTLWFASDVVGRIERQIRARDLWKEIVHSAHAWAEPGLLFWDTVIRGGTSNYAGMTPITTNPCSEIPLDDGGACNLGSLNLARFVRDPFTPNALVDMSALLAAVGAGVRFLDNTLTYNQGRHPLPDQEESARRSRRIGLGITGLGDALVMLGRRYDSDEAIDTAEFLMRAIKEAAYTTSVAWAIERGPFPAFDVEKHLSAPFFDGFPSDLLAKIRNYGLRNVSLLTIPPVGSGSALAGVTNGLEPIFALHYLRRSESLSVDTFGVLHPLVSAYFHATGQTIDPVAISCMEAPDAYLQERLPAAFVTAHQVAPLKRVEMQAALQRHIDQGISSTVNLPQDATEETVSQIYVEAWRCGLKGVSVYREGSREGVLLTTRGAKPDAVLTTLRDDVVEIAQAALPSLPAEGVTPAEHVKSIVRVLADAARPRIEQLELLPEEPGLLRSRPQHLPGVTYRTETPEYSSFVTITEHNGHPFEIFATIGKNGAQTQAIAESIGRLSSFILRMKDGLSGEARLQGIFDQLDGIGSNRPSGFGPNKVHSIPDSIAVAIGRYLRNRHAGTDSFPDGPPRPADPHEHEAQEPRATPNGNAHADICPRCHHLSLVTTEGCAKCACGYREC
ncbi:MAG: adenosylcobalamin-dependent ribonucleoside-diphosphate reductase [bacterium]|nr:adenosylcobalamin-dependent ribonucleoside-diphosphate reductase [bacterium]